MMMKQTHWKLIFKFSARVFIFTFVSITVGIVIGNAFIHIGRAQTRTHPIFPKRIIYDILKKDKVIGNCVLSYASIKTRTAINRELSTLELRNFQGFGISLGETWHTYLFKNDLSLYLETILKNRKIISQVKVGSEIDKKGEKNWYTIYIRKGASGSIRTDVFYDYMFINFLTSLVEASRRIAAGEITIRKTFNFVQGKSTYTVRMIYIGEEDIVFHGLTLPVRIVSIVRRSVEQYRLKIYKDKSGFCIPLRILIQDKDKGELELRAERFMKPETRTITRPVKKLFVSQLTFIDFSTQSALASQGMGGLIDNAVSVGIQQAAYAAADLTLNETGHQIPNTTANINKLAGILFDPALTKKTRDSRIVTGMMIPYGVDILVTGLYIRNVQNMLITVRPMVIIKSRWKILSVNIDFKQEELIDSSSSRYPYKQQLKKAAVEKIARAVKSLLEKV